MLTRERLPKMCQWAWAGGELKEQEVRDLLKFAETMLPLRDALLALLSAEGKVGKILGDYTGRIQKGSPAWDATNVQIAANNAFWKLARELADADAEVKPC